MADKRDILINLLGKETISPAADKAGRSMEKLGDQMGDTADDAKRLDREIDQAEASLRDLAVQYARTGDAAERIDLTKAMRRQQAELRKLTKVQSLLPDFDDGEAVRLGGRIAAGVASGLSRAGGPISAALSNTLGALPPQAQVAIGAGLVGSVVAAAPAIGAVLAGAVTGAAGAGGILGGIAIASRHPAVKAAAKATGASLAEELERAAVSFVPATVHSLGIVQSEIGEIGDDLKRAFSAAAPMLAPLTRDVLAGAEEAVDGFATAVERSGPVVRVLGDIAREAGDLVGDTFVQLSGSAYEGSRAVAALWGTFEAGTRILVNTVSGLAQTYGLAEKFGALLIGDRDKLVQLIVEEHNAKAASGGLSTGMQELLNAVQGFGGGAATATGEVRTLGDAIDELSGNTLDVRAANREFEEAVDRASESVKRNGATLAEGTAKGRENQAALDAIAQATRRKAAATLTATDSQAEANKVTLAGRAAFLRAADAMGMEEGRAKALADKLFGIPNVDRTVSVKTAKAQAAIAAVQAGLGKINSKNITVGVWYKSNGDLKLPGGTSLKGAAAGGPVEGPGPKGIDSVPMMLAPGEHVVTAREVDAAGGQAGMERIRALLRGEGGGAAAGAGVAIGGGAPTVVNYNIAVNVPAGMTNLAEVGRTTVEAIRAYERTSGKTWRKS